jgi:hypothetical protein
LSPARVRKNLMGFDDEPESFGIAIPGFSRVGMQRPRELAICRVDLRD